MSDLTLRPATIGDAADIHALMIGLASDIPLAVDTLEREEALYAAVRKLLAFGQSWVATDGGSIVGFALVDSAESGRHWAENEMLSLRYAAGDGLDALIAKVLERKVPIAAGVRDANRTGLAERLERLGFRVAETRIGERRFHRDP